MSNLEITDRPWGVRGGLRLTTDKILEERVGAGGSRTGGKVSVDEE